jgi:hypothetical protein
MAIGIVNNINAFGFGGSKIYDRYVNATLGSDDNDGTSPSKAWATLAKVVTYTQGLTSGDYKKVFISTGDYGGYNFISTNFIVSTVIELHFQVGCQIIGTGIDTYSGINISNGGANLTIKVFGNNLVIKDFLLSSGNGIASNGDHTSLLEVHNVNVTNCDDGISAHSASVIKVYDSNFYNCVKSAWAHINTSTVYHYRCNFTGRSGASAGIGTNVATTRHYFEDCTFTPVPNGQQMDITRCDLVNCKIGTSSLYINAAGIDCIATNCYINVAFDSRYHFEWYKCYGLVTMRIRGIDSGILTLIKNCVIVGNASGRSEGFQYGNYDALDGTWDGYPVDVKDSVIMNFATAIGAGFSANQKTTFSASSFVRYCNLYNNTTDIASGITCGSNNIDINPILGSYSGSTNQSDYAITAAECIGTGSDGGNIGFTINDI